MALPVSISTASFPPNGNAHVGPFISSAGNVYFLNNGANTGGDYLRVAKATDPTSSFNNSTLTASAQILGMDCTRFGDDIHIAVRFSASIAYFRYNMASDSLTQAEVTVTSSLASGTDTDWASIVRRINGDLLIAYNGAQTSIMGVSYHRTYFKVSTNNGATWGTEVALDSAAKSTEAHQLEPVLVLGEDGVVHGIWADGTTLRQAAISAANAVQTRRDTGSTVSTPDQGNVAIGKPASFTRSTTTKIRVPFLGSASSLLSLRFDAAADPSSFAADTVQSAAVHAAATPQLRTSIFEALAVDSNNDSYATDGFSGISDSQEALYSAWVKMNASGTNQSITGASNTYILRATSANKFYVEGRNSSNTIILAFTSNTSWVVGLWYHVAWSCNMATPTFAMIINGIVDSATPSTLTSGTIDYTRANYGLANRVFPVEQQADCDLAEVFFHCGSGTSLDLSTTANKRKFIDGLGRPVDLGSDGSAPLSTQPLFYASRRQGDSVSTFFSNRGSGGTITQVDGATGWTGVGGPR